MHRRLGGLQDHTLGPSPVALGFLGKGQVFVVFVCFGGVFVEFFFTSWLAASLQDSTLVVWSFDPGCSTADTPGQRRPFKDAFAPHAVALPGGPEYGAEQ